MDPATVLEFPEFAGVEAAVDQLDVRGGGGGGVPGIDDEDEGRPVRAAGPEGEEVLGSLEGAASGEVEEAAVIGLGVGEEEVP